MNIFRSISRAISRLSGSTAPVPGGGAMTTQVGAEEVQAVQEEEFPAEEQPEGESE